MEVSSGSPRADRYVKIHLKDLQEREFLPDRIIYLFAPTFDLKIGRGSQTEANLHPQKSNAWFTSRVMSREHAVLRADPLLKRVYLEDAGSMHGTYIEGARLEKDLPMEIKEHEKIQFGTEIVRGDQTYDPLELSLESINWNDAFPPLFPKPHREVSMAHKNSFSVDYSDEEDEASGADVQVISASSTSEVRQDRDRQVRTFSVPDSDESDSSDVDKEGEQDSLPSSLTQSPNLRHNKTAMLSTPTKVINTHPSYTLTPKSATPGSTVQNALNVSDDEEEKEPKLHKDFSYNGIDEIDVVDDDEIDTDEDHDISEEDIDDYNQYCSEDEYMPDEDEEQVFDDMHENGSSAAETQPPTESHLRAPSPSDAAMPKPSWYMQANLPAIHNLVDQAQPQAMPFADSFSAGPPPLPHFQPFGYYTGMSWPSTDGNPSFPAPYDCINVPSVQSIQQTVQESAQQCMLSLKQHAEMNMQQPASAYNTNKDNTLNKPSKVSINDIIENIGPDQTATYSSRKRKADEISAEADSEAHTQAEEEVTSTEAIDPTVSNEQTRNQDVDITSSVNTTSDVEPSTEVAREKGTPSKKSVTFSPDTIIIESNSERPRKRVKHNREGQGSNFFKYVATAVVGMTFGAVTTVFGLAALPADYFV